MVSASVDSESTVSENKSSFMVIISLVTGCCGPFVKRTGDFPDRKTSFRGPGGFCSVCFHSYRSDFKTRTKRN